MKYFWLCKEKRSSALAFRDWCVWRTDEEVEENRLNHYDYEYVKLHDASSAMINQVKAHYFDGVLARLS